MAIYHLEAKVVSRGAGRSAVAAAAYMSCSRIYNDYDGMQHDYTRKQGLAWQQVFLPEYAPPEWIDRSVLWNAVEENEKTKNSRLAREFVVALPVEFEKEAQVTLLTEYVQNSFVADGMCADAAIHNTGGHNPHAHILLTVRPLNTDGTWQYKTEKEYLCVRSGEERGFTANEYRAVQTGGWEKQYLYKVEKKDVYMPPSEATKHGYARADKHPKSTRFGRQNPISERWNSDGQLVLWRTTWAETVNRALEQNGYDTRIDHRSHAERGLDEQPTIHEGVIARLMEREGMVSDRCELNRQIRADNRLLRELKAQVKKFAEAVRNTIPAIAEALETMRENMLIFSYQLRHIRFSKRGVAESLAAIQPDFSKYTGIVKRLTDMSKQRQELLAEKKNTPTLHLSRNIELSRRIATLTEDMEELRNEKQLLLHLFEKTDDAGMTEVRQRVNDMEATLQKLAESDKRYMAELDAALIQYKELCNQAEPLDQVALSNERQAIRSAKLQDATGRLRAAYGYQYESEHLRRADKDVTKLLDEPEQKRESVVERLNQNRQGMKKELVRQHKHRNNQER